MQGGAGIRKLLRAALLALPLAAPGTALAQPADMPPLAITDAVVGRPGSNAVAELFPLVTPGRHPAVIVLHTCGGVMQMTRDWARRLNDWGYVALMVDSFRPRKTDSVCDNGTRIPPGLRARDAYAAASWLAAQDFVDPAHIGAIGFSHGGSTALALAIPRFQRQGDVKITASIGYYPGCRFQVAPTMPVLILVGDKDDWTPAQDCRDYLARVPGADISMTIYPGVRHSFDVNGPTRNILGHWLEYDSDAAADSFKRTREFLARHLAN